MIAGATTTVSIMRGTTVDEFGDSLDNSTVAASGIPLSIIEQSKRVFDPVTSTARVIRYYTGRATSGTDIQEGDRILDEATGSIYAIDYVSQPPGPFHMPDMHIDLSKVN